MLRRDSTELVPARPKENLVVGRIQMPERHIPKWSELRPLLRPKPIELNLTRRRLDRALTINDLRTLARRRTPRAVFDYTDGAAEGEISLRRARGLFQTLEFYPSVLRDVSSVDTTTSLLGRPSALPFAFAPTGFTRMMNHQGECAVVRMAEKYGIPYALSTLGTTSIEDVAAAAPAARKWFQLYVWNNTTACEELNDAGVVGLAALGAAGPQVWGVVNERPNHQERSGANRQVDVKIPAPVPIVGDPSAERRTHDRRDHQAHPPRRHRELLFVGRECLHQDRL